MQVRVFEAEDMNSGLRLVRKELGPDALILSTKTVKNGKLGLLGKPTIEITAAVDSSFQEPTPGASFRKNSARPASSNPLPVKNTIDHTVGGGDDIRIDYTESPAVPVQKEEANMLYSTPHEEQHDTPLRGEVDELKDIVRELTGQISELKNEPGQGNETPRPTTDLRKRLGVVNNGLDPILEFLYKYGIEGEPASIISEFAKENLSTKDLADRQQLRRFVIDAIEDLVEVKPCDFSSTNIQKRVALIGPTGVGKTTTLAKLAAHHMVNHSNSIALITIDTYRIAAVEQIKVYGEIMHLPVEVVVSPEQFRESLKRHADKSLILIDTAGRSPKDSLSIDELTTFMPPELGVEKHLVLSSSTRENELLATIGRFDKAGIDRLLFTKVDECAANGVILGVQTKRNIPLSYITNGQRVPEDLLQITRRSVAEFIMSPNEANTKE